MGTNFEKILSKIIFIIFLYISSFLSNISKIYSFNLKNNNNFSLSLIILDPICSSIFQNFKKLFIVALSPFNPLAIISNICFITL